MRSVAGRVLFFTTALAALTALGCGGVADSVEQADGSLRAALARSPEELELVDLIARRAVAERLLETARLQVQAGETEAVDAEAEVAVLGAVAEVDDARQLRGEEPIVAAVVRNQAQELTVLAGGPAMLFRVDSLIVEQLDPSLRVDSAFGNEPSEALGGRSEAQTVEALSGLLGELAREAAPEQSSWTVMRRPGLRAGLVVLPEEGIIELNPALPYYLSALARPDVVDATTPAAVADPEARPPAEDWDIFMRWLEGADPSDWTNLGTGQTYDSGYYDDPYDPTPTYASLCPCCYCSSFGLGVQGPAGGVVVVLATLLPLGFLLALRRRG